MTGWLIVAAYAVGWALVARKVAIAMIEEDASQELARRDRWRQRFHEAHEDEGTPLIDRSDRTMAAIFGALTGVVWPAAIIVMAVSRTLRAPSEKLADQRAELETLRKLAREHNLPMPGGES